jgi:nicotinate dehydrogenase subunit B
MTEHFIPSRRDLLKSGGALVVGFSFAEHSIAAFAEELTATKPLALTSVDTFLAIDSASMVTVYSGKVDLGTGVQTALAQIAAEELDVPFRNVKIVQGDTALTPDQGPTFGSLSIQIGGVQIRNAAAMAKNALFELAATRLGVKADELTITDGVVSGGGKQVSYGELIAGKTFSLTLDHQKPPATKDAKNFKIVGTSVPRVDIPDKVTGKFTYMQDFRVPGMLHGRVVRPPAIGAQLQNVDEKSIEGIPGNVRIVREGNFLGVVAENEWTAIKASQQIKTTWSAWEGLPDQAKVFEDVRASRVAKDEVTADVGNAAEAMGKEGVPLMNSPSTHMVRSVPRAPSLNSRTVSSLRGRVTSDAQSPQAACKDGGAVTRERALSLYRRLRLLRPQWT